MPRLATRIERKAGRPLTAIEIFNISASRETTLSRLLTLYICTGLAFMLLPGTFLGVWNLIIMSAYRSSQTVSSAWIQAHGHAQIFGWIGTFILGIGFYSIPKLRRLNSFGLSAVYTAWGLWTAEFPLIGFALFMAGIVDRILGDFRAGRQNCAEFWIDLHGKFVHIRYFAIRDKEGKYLGTAELTQDIAPMRALTGERRLLQYN
jgi:hypothetical protein